MNNSPLRYPGGKHKLFRFVKQLVEENGCSTYIEPFCGGAAVALELLRTGTVEKIILNDFDQSIYTLWKVILEKPEELIQIMEQTPVTIDEWYRQKSIRENAEEYSDVELAFSTLFLNRTNRSGIIDKAGPIGGKEQKGNYKLDCRFKKDKLTAKIRLIHSMADHIELYNLESRDFLLRVIAHTEKALTFFDPPYYKKGRELYSDYLEHTDHTELANLITGNLRDKKWLVTYDNAPEIKEMYSTVTNREYSLQYTLQTKVLATEFIAFSPALCIPDATTGIHFVN